MDKERMNLAFFDAYFDGKYLWVSNVKFNGFFKISCVDYQVQYLGSFPEEKAYQSFLYKKVFFYNNSLYFIPDTAKRMAVYNFKTKSMKSCFTDQLSKIGIEWLNVSDVLFDNDIIWIFPRVLTQPLLKIDLKTQKVNAHQEWTKAIKKSVKNKTVYADVVKWNDAAWTVVMGSSMVMELKLGDGKVYCHDVGGKNLHLFTIGHDGECFYLSHTDREEILSWKPHKGIINQFSPEQKSNKEVSCPYNRFICANHKVFAVPGQRNNRIMLLNMENKTLIPVEPYPTGFYFTGDFKSMRSHFRGYHIQGKRIWLYPFRGNMLLVLDTDTLKITGKLLPLPEEDNEWYIRNVACSEIRDKLPNGFMLESNDGNLSLGVFLDTVVVCGGDLQRNQCKDAKSAIGDQTWRCIKSEWND